MHGHKTAGTEGSQQMKLTRRQSFNAHLLFAPSPQAVTAWTGMEQPGPKRHNKAPEKQVLNAVLSALRTHPKVAWVVRMNSGAYKTPDGRFIRFGFAGCPDLLGQMRTGALLMIECKSDVGRVSEDQQAVIDRVVQNGGHAGVARSVEDALAIVDQRLGP